MAIEEHVAILEEGVGIWNTWRFDQIVSIESDDEYFCRDDARVLGDFSGADLVRINLSGADFSLADLTGTTRNFERPRQTIDMG